MGCGGRKEGGGEGADPARVFSLKQQAEALGIATVIISDAGLTEIPPGTETVLGLGPAPNNIIDQVTGELPLL